MQPDAREAIDLGCGTGVLATALATARPGLVVTAVDASSAAVRSALATVEANGVAESAFAAAFGAVADVPPPLRTAFSGSPQQVEVAWTRAKELKRALGTEVVGVLGVTLSFSDNDGD